MEREFSRSDRGKLAREQRFQLKRGKDLKKEKSDAKTLGQNSLLLSQAGLKCSILLTSQVRNYMYVPLFPTQ